MLEQRPSAEYLARGNFADLYAFRKLVQQEPELSDTAKDLLRAVLSFVARYAEPNECTVPHLLKVLELLKCPDHDEGVPVPVEDSGFGLLFREVIDGYYYEKDTAEWVRRIEPDTTSPTYQAWSALLRGNTDRMIYDSAEELSQFLRRHEALANRLMQVHPQRQYY